MGILLGRQLVADLYGCDPRLLDNEPFLRHHVREAARAAGATVLGVHSHRFAPVGISVVAVLSQSHLAIHTWPEYGICSLDLYLCGDSLTPRLAREHMARALGAERFEEAELPRGTALHRISRRRARVCQMAAAGVRNNGNGTSEPLSEGLYAYLPDEPLRVSGGDAERPSGPADSPPRVGGQEHMDWARRAAEAFKHGRQIWGPHRWLHDWASPWEYTAHAVRGQVCRERSEYQEIDILETEAYGRCLILDGEVQSYEADEHIYHECLVHPAFLLHPGPRSVLVVGGGEGATIREVLRHRSVERVIMAELDPHVVDVCRRHLPGFHAGAFDHPAVRFHFGDGREFVENCQEKFDAVILDLTNPIGDSLSSPLFTVEFYEATRRILNPGAVVVVQSDAVSFYGLTNFASIYRTMREVFPSVYVGATYMPSFTTDWSFTIAGERLPDPLGFDVDTVDRLLRERLNSPTRFYDGHAHQRMFHLPRYVREAMESLGLVRRDADLHRRDKYSGVRGGNT